MATSFVQELKRRNVFRVAIIYFVVSWLLMQVGDVMFPALLLPDWTSRMLIAFLILGMPIALVFAWAYEVTPEGIKRTVDITSDESITTTTGRRIDFLIIGILVIAVALLALKIWTSPGSEPVELALDTEKSIAVLPFKNLSANQENAEFFASGVHDELLTLLSKIGELKVISRTSVERIDPTLGTTAIGELLSVATVLEGQVQRAGNQLRINVQLIRAADDSHIWANIYDRELTAENVFAVQSDIARTIAAALHAELSGDDEIVLNTAPTRNFEALEHYMLGQQLIERGSFDALFKAGQHFQQATALDPDYAEGWAALARAHNVMFKTGSISLEEYVAVARPAIARAIEINGHLAEAHSDLGSLLWQTGEIDAAENSFRTALAMNPDSSENLFAYGSYLRFTGRPRDALPVLEKALTGDPLSARIRFAIGKAEMFSGHPERFVIQARKILEIDPSSVHGYVGYLQAYEDMGRLDLMWPWYIKAMDLDPDDHELWAYLAYYSELLGASEWVDPYLSRARELAPGEPTVAVCRAYIFAIRGQTDEALPIARASLTAGLADRMSSMSVFLRFLRDEALRSGQFDEAMAAYREQHPELFVDPPQIAMKNIFAASDLALLLRHSAKPKEAEVLIETAIDWYEGSQFRGVHGNLTAIADIQLFALNGDTEKALNALVLAVADGWASDWRWHLSNPNLDSIRDAPKFLDTVARLEYKMATQLAVIKALPDMGKLDLRFKELN
ncbi:MAG: tetratricopeptide repeat protein [Proteobacteria bacterium]|nr:tetratricopeptide repeat protein [Pseudomonadota bacterium]